jgi:hypothetical protein
MKETYYTREDFLNWYLDALLLVSDLKKWNEELWRENPPRFYRFLRLYALGQGLGLDCPLRDVGDGKFLKPPFGNYQSACDKISAVFPVTGLDGSSIQFHAEDMWVIEAQWVFSKFFTFRLALQRVLKFNSGMLECGSGGFKFTYFATEKLARGLQPQAKQVDEILCEFLAPHNPRLSEQVLVEEYGFPVVSLRHIDDDWI